MRTRSRIRTRRWPRCSTAPPFYVDLAAFARDRALGAATSIDQAVERCGASRIADAELRWPVAGAAGCGSSARSLADAAKFHADNPDLAGHRVSSGCALQLEPRLPAPAFSVVSSRDLQRARRDRARRRLGAACRPRSAADAGGRKALEQDRSRCSAGRSGSVRRACATSPAALRVAKPTCGGCSSCSAAWARSTRSRTIISSCARTVAEMVEIVVDVAAQRRQAASSPPRSFATGSTMAARSRSRFSNSSIATA